MKKVLLVGTSGGMASGVSTHIDQLMASLADKFSLDRFVVGSRGCFESIVNKIKRYLFSPIAFATKIVTYQPDVVHLNTAMDFKAFSRDAVYLVIAKLLRRKIVLQLHAGLAPQVFFNRRALLSWFRRMVLQCADAVILLTRMEEECAGDFCHFRALYIVPNAVDVTAFARNRKMLVSNSNETTLVYIGRLVEAKGLKEGIEAVAILKQQGLNNFKFKIAGEGPHEQTLKHLCEQLGVNDRVEFVGSVFGSEKMRFWRDASLLVFPTRFPEGLPYALLEALASGVPIITTRVNGISEAIEEGVHGFFVPAEDSEAVARAINYFLDGAKVEAMSHECVKRAAERYGLERLAEQVEKIYKSL